MNYPAIEQIDLKPGISVTIKYDTCPQDPCEDYDMLFTFVCSDEQHNLGHKQTKNAFDAILEIAYECFTFEDICRAYRKPGESWDEAACIYDWELEERFDANPDTLFKKLAKTHIIAPLYLYERSGLSISCDPFAPPRDPGQVGVAFASLKKIRDAFLAKRLTKDIRQRAIECLKSEVKMYSNYLEGNIYAYFTEDAFGNVVDGCCGFDDLGYCEKVAIENAQPFIDEAYARAALALESTRPDMYLAA